jgi:hypothetical protein
VPDLDALIADIRRTVTMLGRDYGVDLSAVAVDPCGMHWLVSWKRPGGKPMRFSTWCSTWNEWASKAKLVEAKDGTANPEA